jgi:death-on-curing protein
MYVLLDLNGVVLDAPDDAAFDLVVQPAAGSVDVPEIAEALRSWCRS